jgi:hypothetical protein
MLIYMSVIGVALLMMWADVASCRAMLQAREVTRVVEGADAEEAVRV